MIGTVIGAVVARSRVLRAGVGSMITGLQTMPSVAWYPLALLLFKLSEGAILFVVVLGAAPAIANGLINGIDTIQPVLLRAGRVLGARRWAAFRSVILPAALPSFVGGLKQGWAFAWRSLLAGEVIGGIAGFSLGQQLQANREFADSAGIVAVMMVIFAVGVIMDILVFGNIERFIRRRYGLSDTATSILGSRNRAAVVASPPWREVNRIGPRSRRWSLTSSAPGNACSRCCRTHTCPRGRRGPPARCVTASTSRTAAIGRSSSPTSG